MKRLSPRVTISLGVCVALLNSFGQITTSPSSGGTNGDGTFAGLDFTGSNFASIATRNFSDLQNIPKIGAYNYFIRLVSGTPTAFDGTGIQVSSNADTGALVNALMPTLSVNPTGAVFVFDVGAFPFATAISHNTKTIKDGSNTVANLAPVTIRGSGAPDAQDNNEPLKLLGTIFYPTSSFPSGSALIKIFPSAASGQFAYGIQLENFSILCTQGGAATFQPYTDATAKSAGISAKNVSNGHIKNVWIGSPNGDGIQVTSTNASVGDGAQFKIESVWVNAVQGTGNNGIRVDLDDCLISNSFVYYTIAGNTDFKIGSGHDQVVRLANSESNGNVGGTVIELTGSAAISNVFAHGTGVNPLVFIKKNGTGDATITGGGMYDCSYSPAVMFYYVSGSGSTTITGATFNGLYGFSELVELAADVPAASVLLFADCSIYGTAISGSFYNLNGHVDYANKQLGPFATNLTALAGYKAVLPNTANTFTGTNTFSGLTVKGGGSDTSVLGDAGFGSYSGFSMNGTLNTTSYNFLSSSADKDLYINVPSASNFRFKVNGTDIGRWYASGGLYLGATVSDPGANNLIVQGTSTFSGGIVGTATNDSAASGNVGQLVSSLVVIGSPQSLSNGTAANVTSISLTAGDWDVEGNVNFTETTSTVTARSAGISTISATLPTDGSEAYCGVQSTVTSETNTITLPRKRISIASTTTVYLVGKATFSAGTCAGFGGITARRVR